MKITWSDTAKRELANIATYIASRNPTAATKVEARLLKSVAHLCDFPRAGRISTKLGTREIVIAEYPYVIRYRLMVHHVQVLRIFHTSTSWIDV